MARLTLIAALVGWSQAAASTRIDLGPATSVVGQGASVDGEVVTIGQGGSYELRGELIGTVVVTAPDELVTLILDGVSVQNPVGPAILVTAAAGVTVELAAGSFNRISDGGTSEYDAALYSDAPLTIDGQGELEVRSVYEGISSTSHITFLGGAVRVVAVEDGLNANEDGVSRIEVRGGFVYAHGMTGDGIDSNGTLHITGGTVVALTSLGTMDTGLDADLGIYIEGGVVAATGASILLPLRTPGRQRALIIDFTTIQNAASLVVVTDLEGELLLAFAPPDRYTRVILSSPDIVAGGHYRVYYQGEGVGEDLGGFYSEVAELGRLAGEARAGQILRIR